MKNMLRVSDAVALGLHAMVLLTKSSGIRMSTHEIAILLNVSENHLSKVCQRLVKADLIESERGPNGGFKLKRPGDQITIMDIYEAIDGPMLPTDCLLDRPACGGDKCLLGGLIESVNRQVMDYFEKHTLSQLACKG